MELSEEMHYYNSMSVKYDGNISLLKEDEARLMESDLVDVNKFDFSSDETWYVF